MHLTYGTYRYKGEEYTSYSIAESYREGKTVRKRILFPLGKLSETQVGQIRLILKVVKGKEHILSSIQDWVKTTVLPQILNLDPDTLNDDKLYYELNKVEANKESLENFLFNKTYQLNSESYNYVNYDLTLKYISALDKNQIPKVEGVNLQLFKDLTVENIREEIESLPGFTKHDDLLYYQDLGQVKDKRYILGINPTLFIEGRSNREEKIELFSRFIHQLN